MDYFKIYQSLVESRLHRGHKRESGFEVHHIVPKTKGGTDDPSNLVKLTYREHFVAHRLLCKMYPVDVGINYAFLCMLRDPHGHRLLTSRMVQTIKENYSTFKKWHSKVSNPGKSQQSRKAASDRMKSDRNPMRGRPEKNPTASPHTVMFMDGTQMRYAYGKQGYEQLGIPRPTWIRAVIKQLPIPKYGVERIIKE